MPHDNTTYLYENMQGGPALTPTIIQEHTDGFKTGFAVMVALEGRLMFDSRHRRQLPTLFTPVRTHLPIIFHVVTCESATSCEMRSRMVSNSWRWPPRPSEM